MKKSFNERCYQILKKVPKGEVTTYKEIANMLGSKAYRAVGDSMNKNPYFAVVPCHRVVRSDGRIGGFVLGTKKKKSMLKKEGINVVGERIDIKKYLHKF